MSSVSPSGAAMMNMERKEFVSCLRSLGCRVSAQGNVTYKGAAWGFVGGKEFQSTGGEVLPIEQIIQVEFDDSKLTLTTDDGGFLIAKAGRMTQADVFVTSVRSMPLATSELNDIFEELFPDCDDQLFFDELKERNVMDMAMLDRPQEGQQPFTDDVIALYHEAVQIRLRDLGCQGRFPSKDVMDEVLTIRTHDHRRNPFREWMESHEWDGVPRVRTWFRDLFGATAPPLTGADEEKYLGDASEIWFCMVVRRQYDEHRMDVVPVLMGDQGIGKGLAIKYMAGADMWYKDTNVDVKDAARFLDSVRGKIVVELSESRQIRNSDSELMKSFISQEVDQIRKPYAKYEGDFPRHFGLIATTNLTNIFTDVTGNRRYFPMFCDGTKHSIKFSIDRSVGQYEVEQVWAEALHMFKTKTGRWYVPKDTSSLAKKVQAFYTVENPGITHIQEYLDSDPIYSQVGARISRTEIMEICFHCPPDHMPTKDMESAYRAWTNGDKSWKRLSSFKNSYGRVSRGFERVSPPGTTPDPNRLGMVDGRDDKPTSEQEFYRVMEENRLDIGDEFPTDSLESYILDDMVEKGYIYCKRQGVYIMRKMP